jgi:hypothetical protein
MAIEIVESPIAAREAVQRVLRNRADNETFRTPNLRKAAPDLLNLWLPMPVAILPLDRIQPDGSLREAATPAAWRFLVREGDGQPIAAMQATAVGAAGYRFGEISEGPAIAGISSAYEHATGLELFRDLHYEPWLLIAPALYVAALWLCGPQPADDWLLPTPPSRPPFAHNEPVTAHDFMKRLADLAARVPRNDSARGG